MLKEVNFHTRPLTCLNWNKDGQYLASASSDKTCKIGAIEQSGNMKSIQSITLTASCAQVCWSPIDPVRFALVGDDKAVELYDVRASRAASKLTSLGSNLYSAWSPDGKYLAVLNRSDSIVIIDVATTKQIKKVKFGYEINELQWTANSNYLLVGTAANDSGNIDILHLHNNELNLIDTIPAHASHCYGLKIDNGLKRLAVGSSDFNLSLWDLGEMVCHHIVPFE